LALRLQTRVRHKPGADPGITGAMASTAGQSSKEPDWLEDTREPRWARSAWRTPLRRLAAALAFTALAVWVLASAITDPDDYFDNRRAEGAFVVAPALLAISGLTVAEALCDLATGDNRRPSLFRVRRRTPAFLAGAVAYVALMVGILLVWRG
jgi:hypothetical protein